jgi:hypothetical protein
VATAEQSHHEQIDDLGLTDNDAANFLLDAPPSIDELANRSDIILRPVAVRIVGGYGFDPRYPRSWCAGRHGSLQLSVRRQRRFGSDT